MSGIDGMLLLVGITFIAVGAFLLGYSFGDEAGRRKGLMEGLEYEEVKTDD